MRSPTNLGGSRFSMRLCWTSLLLPARHPSHIGLNGRCVFKCLGVIASFLSTQFLLCRAGLTPGSTSTSSSGGFSPLPAAGTASFGQLTSRHMGSSQALNRLLVFGCLLVRGSHSPGDGGGGTTASFSHDGQTNSFCRTMSSPCGSSTYAPPLVRASLSKPLAAGHAATIAPAPPPVSPSWRAGS